MDRSLMFRNTVNINTRKSETSSKCLEGVESTISDSKLIDPGRSLMSDQPQIEPGTKSEKDCVSYPSRKAEENIVDLVHEEQDMERIEDEEFRSDAELLRNLIKELENLNMLDVESKELEKSVSKSNGTREINVYHESFPDLLKQDGKSKEKKENERKVRTNSENDTNILRVDTLNIDCKTPLQKNVVKLPITKNNVRKLSDDLIGRDILDIVSKRPSSKDLHRFVVRDEIQNDCNNHQPSKEWHELAKIDNEISTMRLKPKCANEVNLFELNDKKYKTITFENETNNGKSVYKVPFVKFVKEIKLTKLPPDVKNELFFLLKKNDILDINIKRTSSNKRVFDQSVMDNGLVYECNTNNELRIIDLEGSNGCCSPNFQESEQNKELTLPIANMGCIKNKNGKSDEHILPSEIDPSSTLYQSQRDETCKMKNKIAYFSFLKKKEQNVKSRQSSKKSGLRVCQNESMNMNHQSSTKRGNIIISRVKNISLLRPKTRRHRSRDSKIMYMERELDKLDIEKEFHLQKSSSSESEERYVEK